MAITTTVDNLGQLLKVWRDGAGFTLKELAAAATEQMPRDRSVSYGTLHRYELNHFPHDGPDSFVLVGVAYACGHIVADYPGEVRTMIDEDVNMLRKPCFPLSSLAAA